MKQPKKALIPQEAIDSIRNINELLEPNPMRRFSESANTADWVRLRNSWAEVLKLLPENQNQPK